MQAPNAIGTFEYIDDFALAVVRWKRRRHGHQDVHVGTWHTSSPCRGHCKIHGCPTTEQIRQEISIYMLSGQERNELCRTQICEVRGRDLVQIGAECRVQHMTFVESESRAFSISDTGAPVEIQRSGHARYVLDADERQGGRRGIVRPHCPAVNLAELAERHGVHFAERSGIPSLRVVSCHSGWPCAQIRLRALLSGYEEQGCGTSNDARDWCRCASGAARRCHCVARKRAGGDARAPRQSAPSARRSGYPHASVAPKAGEREMRSYAPLSGCEEHSRGTSNGTRRRDCAARERAGRMPAVPGPAFGGVGS